MEDQSYIFEVIKTSFYDTRHALYKHSVRKMTAGALNAKDLDVDDHSSGSQGGGGTDGLPTQSMGDTPQMDHCKSGVTSDPETDVRLSIKTHSEEHGVFNMFLCHLSEDGGHLKKMKLLSIHHSNDGESRADENA